MYRICLPVAFLAIAIVWPAWGQSTFGGIVGSVKDTSGSAVPDAAIVVRNIDENTSRRAASSGVGLYEVLNLPPGNYEVTATKAGFTTVRLGQIHLDARQTVRADLRLEVAAVKEIVDVAGTVAAINTESATIADTKTFTQITQLPVNYRGKTTSPLGAILTVPGVEQDTAGNISVSGGLPAQTDYSVDGVSTVSVRNNGPLKEMYPSSEMLSEFRVTKVNNNAEFGQMGDITVATKSGGNMVHGSGFWYHQNAAFDAVVYNAPQKPAKVFNTFGGSLSGPVVIPKVWDGRNRTFFFVDYEGNREPGSTLGLFDVPTVSMRSGNLIGLPGNAAVDPTNHAPFPSNIVPVSRISSVSSSLLADYFPLPNSGSASNTLNNYRRLLNTPSSTDGYDIRIDQIISPRQQLFARWSWKDSPYVQGNGTFLPGDEYGLASRNLLVSHNFTIAPNILNEFRFGLSIWTLDDHFPLSGESVVTTLGLQGLDLSSLPASTGGFPNFDFSDGTGFSPVLHSRDGITRSLNYQINDNLSWIKGRHTIKFGADVRWLGYDDVLRYEGADGFGNFTFTSSAFSGNAYVDFLLGIPAMSYYAIMGPNLQQRATHYQFYGQDEWRISDRVTVSYGLRYEIHPPMDELSGNITNFDPATASVIVPDHTLPAAPGFLAGINACPGTTTQYPCTHIVTANQEGLGKGLRHTYYGNWDPRFSVAWRPFGNKTVIRSGFGVFTENVLGPTAYPLTGVHTSDLRTYTNFQGVGKPPLFTFPQVAAGAFAISPIGNENFVSGMDVYYKDPRSYQWNLTMERELRGGTTVRASYIGSNTIGLGLKEDINQVPASKTPYSASLKPYPDWAQLAYFYNTGFANYNAVDAEVTHIYRDGLFFQGSYTFSKSIGNAAASTGGAFSGTSPLPSEVFTGLITDRFNTRLDRGNLPGTRPQRFLLTTQYDLPFGRSRRFGSHMNRVMDAFLGGWNLSSIVLLQDGPWVTAIMSQALDQSNTNMLARGARSRPNRVRNGNLSNPTQNDYFDINAFALPPPGCGCFGNAGEGILEGPGTVAVAGGLAKRFTLTERVHIRLEGTFTNLPNHPNFLPPATNISTPISFGKLTTVQSQENSGNRTGQISARLDF